MGEKDRVVTYPAAINDADGPEAICFAGATKSMAGAHKIDALVKIRETKAGVIITSKDVAVSSDDFTSKTLILVDNPRLAYARVLRALFARPPNWGIHPTAVINDQADIHPNVYIGPYTVVGKSKIGEGTIIHGQVFIYDNCTIGRNVVIYPGCIIGAEGFGFERNEQGEMEKFPQLGGLIIEDNVEIQGLCNLDKGTLGETVIGEGTKIDTASHIGHNTLLGKHCLVAAHTMIGAGIHVGDFSWISPSSAIRNRVKIGTRSQVGIGAVVVKDVPPDTLVMGVPAQPADEFKRFLKKMKE